MSTNVPTTVADHYANHLAPIYSWMVGDFDVACAQSLAFYKQIGLPEGGCRVAVDLGCGHGIHSIPLGRRGYRVFAIDSSRILLDELKSRAGQLPIQIIEDDLTGFSKHLAAGSVALVTCMGDTLPHLLSPDEVSSVIHDAARCLMPGGILLISLRDYTLRELEGDARFIPVRSDEGRIHVCFLEYQPGKILVHDIIHTRTDSGWQTTVSAYPKLRLSPDALITIAESNGLLLTHRATNRGMVHLAFGLLVSPAEANQVGRK